MKSYHGLCVTMVLLLMTVFVFGFAQESFASDKKIRIKMSTPGSDTSPSTIGARKWAELAKKESGGRIGIQIYPNEQLSSGNQAKGIENLQMGITEAHVASTLIYSVLDPKFGVISLPWLMPDYESVDKAFAGKGADMLKDLIRAKGIEPLNFMENGFRQVTNNVRPIKTPEDMKNLKIRVPSMKLYIDLFKALGADPTVMNLGEVFTSLQQGTIDGQENPIAVIHSRKFYEVQKYLTMMNYSYDTFIVGMNKGFWEKLDAEDKKILTQTLAVACEFEKKLARDMEREQIKDMESKGIKLNVLTPDAIEKFRNKSKPVFEKYSAMFGADLVKAFSNPK